MIYTILSKMSRNATKTENWEASVIVVWLNDDTNVHKSSFILVIASHVVQRIRIARFSVGSCVIDGSDHGYRPTRAQVVNESRPLIDV